MPPIPRTCLLSMLYLLPCKIQLLTQLMKHFQVLFLLHTDSYFGVFYESDVYSAAINVH